jgi:predicted Fe-Mo cluster-binding NifX family protein
MKVCITARGPSLESLFGSHFARSPYFILYNTHTATSEAIRNGFVIGDTRIGQNTVRLLKLNGIESVITGSIGDNARDLLKGAGIPVSFYKGEGTVQDALDTILKYPMQ